MSTRSRARATVTNDSDNFDSVNVVVSGSNPSTQGSGQTSSSPVHLLVEEEQSIEGGGRDERAREDHREDGNIELGTHQGETQGQDERQEQTPDVEIQIGPIVGAGAPDPDDGGNDDSDGSGETNDPQRGGHHHGHGQGHRRGSEGTGREGTADSTLSQSSLRLRDVLAQLAQSITTIGSSNDDSNVKGPSISAPAKFTGRDRTKLRTFLAQCRLVFKANPRKYKKDSTKVTFVCSYLDDLAFRWYENHLVAKAEPAWFSNFQQFEEQLKENFGEINESATAERKIRRLRMSGSEKINDYITTFNTYANSLDWNESALISEFRVGLPSRIKDELARLHDDDFDTLKELRDACIRIDFRHWDREMERSNENRSESRPPAKTYQKPTSTFVRSTTTQTSNSRDPRFQRRTTQNYSSSTAKPKIYSQPFKPLPLDTTGHVTSTERSAVWTTSFAYTAEETTTCSPTVQRRFDKIES